MTLLLLMHLRLKETYTTYFYGVLRTSLLQDQFAQTPDVQKLKRNGTLWQYTCSAHRLRLSGRVVSGFFKLQAHTDVTFPNFSVVQCHSQI